MSVAVEIMIIEDDAVIAMHLEQMLRGRGYHVTGIWGSGEEAVAKAKALRPNVILMDIHLRGKLNGVETSLLIHQAQDTPIVFLTAFADEKLLSDALSSEPYGYLTKPVRENELVASIEVALYKHQVNQKVQHLNQVLNSIRSIARLITHQPDPEALIQEACQILYQTRDYRLVWIHRLVDAQWSAVARFGEHQGFVDMASADLAASIARDDVSLESSPWASAVKSLLPVTEQSVNSDAAPVLWRQAALKNGFLSSAAIPMVYAQQLIGLLCVESSAAKTFDAEEVNLLQDLANDLAHALHAIEEENQRKKAENLIRREEARLQSLYAISQCQTDNEAELFSFALGEIRKLTDSQFGFLVFFQNSNDFFFSAAEGFTGPRLTHVGFLAMFQNSDLAEKIHVSRKAVVDNKHASAAAKHRSTEDGGYPLERFITLPVIEAEEITGIAMFGNKPTDYDEVDLQQIQQLIDAVWKIVAKTRVDKALVASEMRYRLVSDFTYDWEYWINPEWVWTYCSPSCERISGYEPACFLNNPHFLRELIHPDDVDAFLQHQNAIADHPGTAGMDFRIIRKDGSVRWISHFCQPVYDADGNYLGLRGSNRDIQQRYEADEALRRSETRYRLLFENMTSAFALHEIILSAEGKPVDYRFLEVNPAFEKLFGLPADIAVGNTVKEVIPNTESYWIGTYGWVALTGESIRFENFSVDLGKYFDIMAFSPQKGQFAVILNDITERKQAESLVQRRVAELEVLYENGLAISRFLEPKDIGYKITDVLSRKLEWNHAAVRVVNRTTGALEVLALHRRDGNGYTLVGDIQRLNEMISRPGQGLAGWVALHGESVRSMDVRSDPRYMETFPGISSGMYVPIRGSEDIIGVISVESTYLDAFDADDERLLTTVASQAAIALENARLYQEGQRELAERRRAEEALLDLNQELEQRVNERTQELRRANAELERASRLKDEFLASMSHELRTPLTGVLNLSEALQEQVYGPLTEKQLRSLRTIEESGRHLLGLINDILDLSKIEAGQFKLQMEECYISDICQSSLQMVRGMAQKKQQNLSFTLKPADMGLKADPRRLKQILVNLLSNAVKFTPEQGEIGLEVTGDEEGGVIRFSVWDKGIGIAAADQQRLFQPFTQLDSSLSRQQSGTGLGLILVQRMADLHGGSVELESETGKGSRFTVTLPWMKVSGSLFEPGVTNPNVTRYPNDEKSCDEFLIMLVDDNPNNLSVYSDYIQIKGYRVVTAQSGQQAVTLTGEEHPDLILMDIQMPGIDGVEAIRQIRSSEDLEVANIPVIALTALAMPGDKERCLAVGANDYLSKPVSLTTLVKTIETYCYGVK